MQVARPCASAAALSLVVTRCARAGQSRDPVTLRTQVLSHIRCTGNPNPWMILNQVAHASEAAECKAGDGPPGTHCVESAEFRYGRVLSRSEFLIPGASTNLTYGNSLLQGSSIAAQVKFTPDRGFESDVAGN